MMEGVIDMESIKRPVQTESEIRHSRFIAYLHPVFSKEEAQATLESIKQAHPDANHHCFAYIIGDSALIQKAEDDGEPAKTAGVPMLEGLKKNGLTNVLAVVVRYFGGVKLGAGGLIRAYGKSVSDAVEKAERTVRTTVLTIRISADFDAIGTIEHLLSDMETKIERQYDEQVHFLFDLPEKEAKTLESTLREQTSDQATFEIKDETVRYL